MSNPNPGLSVVTLTFNQYSQVLLTDQILNTQTGQPVTNTSALNGNLTFGMRKPDNSTIHYTFPTNITALLDDGNNPNGSYQVSAYLDQAGDYWGQFQVASGVVGTHLTLFHLIVTPVTIV